MIGMIAALLWGWLQTAHAGFSSIYGALIAMIPNGIFALRLFKYQGAQAVNQIVKSFYRAEMLKIVTTVVLFILFIVFFRAEFLPLMGTYILCQLGFWLFPWFRGNNPSRNKS